MDMMTRRETLDLLARGGLACGGACALSRFAVLDALAEDAADKDPFQVATVDFASEPGRKLSRLGFGMMRLPCRGRGEIDEELSDKLVDYAIRHGVNYFDTAWMYIGGKSQYYTGKVLEKYDREKFLDLYRDKVGEKADASRCTACGSCHPKCPQHIKVAKEFKKVNALVASIRQEYATATVEA